MPLFPGVMAFFPRCDGGFSARFASHSPPAAGLIPGPFLIPETSSSFSGLLPHSCSYRRLFVFSFLSLFQELAIGLSFDELSHASIGSLMQRVRGAVVENLGLFGGQAGTGVEHDHPLGAGKDGA